SALSPPREDKECESRQQENRKCRSLTARVPTPGEELPTPRTVPPLPETTHRQPATALQGTTAAAQNRTTRPRLQTRVSSEQQRCLGGGVHRARLLHRPREQPAAQPGRIQAREICHPLRERAGRRPQPLRIVEHVLQ